MLKMKKSVLVIGSLFIIFMATLTPYVTRTQTTKESKNTSILRFALPFDVASLDVNSRAHDGNSSTIIRLLFEGLMTKNKKGIPECALAHQVDINADGTKGPKQIESHEDNKIIGKFFRRKLNLNENSIVEKEDLLRYGKTYIDIYKVNDETYLIDF